MKLIKNINHTKAALIFNRLSTQFKVKAMIATAVIVTMIMAFNHRSNLPGDPSTASAKANFWQIRSIDTMKYSRDVAREKLDDKSFDKTIDTHVKNIAATGATHVAIATPYDEEFYPFLVRWVEAARNYDLNVWFRGNFAGWERWFDYAPIDRRAHMQKTAEFIHAHPELFHDGDIFTSCPECENGGPGDPRMTRDIDGHRQFLISEYETSKKAFLEIGKYVRAHYYSMNGDVARLIMDKKTTQALDGIVVIDHYVASSHQLIFDINEIARESGGQVVLGEFGAPIPDVHGDLSADEQAAWIDQALDDLVEIPTVIGINYWVGVGGSTRLWEADGQTRPAVATITSYYRPTIAIGSVKNEILQTISNARIIVNNKTFQTDESGQFAIPLKPGDNDILVTARDYIPQAVVPNDSTNNYKIVLIKDNPSLWYKLFKQILSPFRRFDI